VVAKILAMTRERISQCGISSNVLLFADDLKLFKVVRCLDDCYALQADLKIIEQWCESNNLPLNIGKCLTMTFSNTQTSIDFEYRLNDSIISRCSTFRDLGILYDSKLTFAPHIDAICNSATKMLGFIIRNTKDFSSKQALITLYNSYVRSKLEYGAIIFNPVYDRYVVQLENIQRKFLKFLAFKCDGTYPPRGSEQPLLLQRFQVPSLLNRRNYLSVQFISKICRAYIDCPDLLMQIQFYVPPRTTRTPSTFFLATPNTNFLLKAPLYRGMSIFNASCSDIDIFGRSSAQLTSKLKNKFLS